MSSARQGVDFIDRTEDMAMQRGLRSVLASAWYNAGKLSESETIFREAEKIQKRLDSDHPILYSIEGFSLCDLLLYQGKVREVLERAKQTLEWAIQYENKFFGLRWINFLWVGHICWKQWKR